MTSQAARALAALVVPSGCRTGPDAGPASAAARARLIEFVDATTRAAAGGASVLDEEPAREPDACGRNRHRWTYSKWVSVAGARPQQRFAAAVKAHWEKGGLSTTNSESRRVATSFEGFHVGVRGGGPDGLAGMVVGGTSPCLPGPGTPVPVR